MNTEAIRSEHAARLTAADPLLPSSDPFAPAGDQETDYCTSTEDYSAEARVARSEVDRHSTDSVWRPLVEHQLTVVRSDTERSRSLSELLVQWDEDLTSNSPAGDWETAAVVPLPSRDSDGSGELLRRGFAPMRVLAVRPADRLAAAGPVAEPGVRIRPAEENDLDTAVALYLELQRYDAQFGLVTLRDNAADLLRKELACQLGRAEPTVWIAELYGRPLGLLQVQFPPDTGWIAPYVRAERVGYLAALHVSESARSSGLGTTLTARAHQLFDEAGADAVLLHHALANPRSTPFWYSQGYRPLWTYWYRRPAVR